MKCEFGIYDIPNFNEVRKCLLENGEEWEAIPGFGIIEVEIDSIEKFYHIVDMINNINQTLKIECMGFSKNNDGDEDIL